MSTKNNISHIHNCYGCGLCAVVCAHKVIDIRLNRDGFYEPHLVNPESCSNCGLCISVCAYTNDPKDDITSPIKSFAAWSKDIGSRRRSTSGGVSYEIGKTFINSSGKFCGARFNVEANRVEHYIAHTEDELKYSIGSKYLQSYTYNAFRAICKKEKNLITGTPCQIASFRRYVKLFHCEDNFTLVDFFCHGVPSKLMWDKYLKEKRTELSQASNITWRNKQRGWKAGYCITIEEANRTIHSYSKDGDDFFALFLGDACLGKACYEKCRFKYDHSCADIRLGDLWGNEKDNPDGISSVTAFTEKGEERLRLANIELIPLSFEEAARGQMKENPHKPWYYKITMTIIKSQKIKLHHIARIVREYKFVNRQLKIIKETLGI